MVRIVTKYDKSINKKVFEVRGDEAYARTTDTEVIVSSPTNNTTNFDVDITVNLYRASGSSIVDIYDGDEIIHQRTVHTGNNTFTLEDVTLSYCHEHYIWAKYHGNSSRLWSKSKKTKLQVQPPTSYLITNTASTQLITNSVSLPISATVKLGGTLVGSGTDVEVYVDEVYKTTLTTDSDGVISGSISTTGTNKLSDGIHNVNLLIPNSDCFGGSLTYNIYVGYIIEIMDYTPVYIDGGTNYIKCKVTNYDNTPVVNETISLQTVTGSATVSSATTDSNGIATITIPLFNQNTIQFRVNYMSNTKLLTISKSTITSIDITPSPSIISYGYSTLLAIQLNGTNIVEGIPVSVTTPSGTSTYLCDSDGKVTVEYSGSGAGHTTISASVGSVSKYVGVDDVLTYWTKNLQYHHKNTGNRVRTTNSYITIEVKPSSSNLPSYIREGDAINQDYRVSYNITTFQSNGKGVVSVNNEFSNGVEFTTDKGVTNRIRVDKDGSTYYVYNNSLLLGSFTSNSEYTVPLFVNTGDSNINIEEIQIKLI